MSKSAKRNPAVLRPGLSIGAPSAESDDEFLFECFAYHAGYEDATRTQSPGMILAGRTGSGKTAIIRKIEKDMEYSTTIDPTEMSMGYVANSDALRFLSAIGADLEMLFQALWKHILCIEFIRLKYRVNDEGRSRTIFSSLYDRFWKDQRKLRPLAYLREWEGKFWITADENIKEITRKFEGKFAASFGAEIEKFRAGGQFEKRLSSERKSEIVDRMRKIVGSNQLTELNSVIDLLSAASNTDDMKKYYILIDGLDDRWADASIRFKLIRALISALKSFRKISNLKIVVALRSDILERVLQETSDLTFQREKFEENFMRIKW